jgi:hypothetical protein
VPAPLSGTAPGASRRPHAPRAVLAPSSLTREDAHLAAHLSSLFLGEGASWSAVAPSPWSPVFVPYPSWARLSWPLHCRRPFAWRVALCGGTNSGRGNPCHNRRAGPNCHNSEMSARAEMTANTGASHPRTACVHPKHVSHIVVISARVEVVFSIWTGVCLSGGYTIRENHPPPSLEHDPVPPGSHALLRGPGWSGGRCGRPVLARHAGPVQHCLPAERPEKGPDICGQRFRLL